MLEIHNINHFPIGVVGHCFLGRVAFLILLYAIIDNIFHLSTSYDQGFEVGKVLCKEMLMVYGQQILHNHLDLLFFIGPICHLGYL